MREGFANSLDSFRGEGGSIENIVDGLLGVESIVALDSNLQEKLGLLRDGNCENLDDELLKFLVALVKVVSNKIAALIYSVAVEEMLRIALSSNVLSGLQVKVDGEWTEGGRYCIIGKIFRLGVCLV